MIEPVDQEAAKAESDRIARLQAFTDSCITKRDAAVAYKNSLGIEEDWDEDEDYYDAKDPYVKVERWRKSTTTVGGLTSTRPAYDSGSDVFDNITAYFVDMAVARASDMLTPTDDKPFKVSATPMPDVSEARNDATPITSSDGMRQTTMGEAAKTMIDEATKSADEAETYIWDKYIGFGWHTEFRKVIFNAMKIGNGVMKGPFPVRRKFKTMSKEEGQVTFTTGYSIDPASKEIDPRNLFPDPGCGEDIQRGSFTWECDRITYKQLREMREMMTEEIDPLTGEKTETPMYLDSQIAKCLEDGPMGLKPKSGKYIPNQKDVFEIWYGYVTADYEDMEAAGCKCDKADGIPAQITIVNDLVIQAALSPVDEGEFPYDIMVFDRIPGTPWGKGVARKVRVQQRQINGLERAWMKNAGLSAGPIIIFARNKLKAIDGGKLGVRPFAVFDADVESTDDVHKLVTTIEIPSRQTELLNGINFALLRAEKLTGLSLQDQGQQGSNMETAQGRLVLQNNSNTLQRRIARNADDGIIEPHVRRYYAYWLAHAEGDKGAADHQIEALGSSALFERDAENQFLLQVYTSGMAKDPANRIDPDKFAKELFRSNKFDPSRIQYTDDEWKQVQEQQAKNPPVDPRIEAIKIKAEADAAKTDKLVQADLQKAQLNTDRDTAYVNAEGQRTKEGHDYNMAKLALEKEIAYLQENGKQAEVIKNLEAERDKLKVEMAQKVMELNTQKELAHVGELQRHSIPQVAPAGTEPPGRAPNGEAFQF